MSTPVAAAAQVGTDPQLAPSKRWQADAAQLAHARSGAARVRLAGLGMIDVDGADALPFLNAQATADFTSLDGARFALAGYCSPKGRLLAIFRAWRTPTGVRLALPREILEATLRRLSMFVLRAKVRLADVSAHWAVLGICGPGSAAALGGAGLAVPDAPGRWQALEQGACLARLEAGQGCPQRFLLVVALASVARWEERLGALVAVDESVWWWSQVDAAVPEIFACTRELFVPQAVNLELLDGVSFRKGCYPGQEVVARSQYRGKLRRRMAIGHAPSIGADGDIYHSDTAQAVGRIVMATMAPGAGWDLLFESPADLTGHGSLHAGGRSADALAVRPLPYPIFDPTA